MGEGPAALIKQQQQADGARLWNVFEYMMLLQAPYALLLLVMLHGVWSNGTPSLVLSWKCLPDGYFHILLMIMDFRTESVSRPFQCGGGLAPPQRYACLSVSRVCRRQLAGAHHPDDVAIVKPLNLCEGRGFFLCRCADGRCYLVMTVHRSTNIVQLSIDLLPLLSLKD